MNALLNSVKADLLDRRILPLVAIVVVAVFAAIGYAVLGGSSASPAPSSTASVTSSSLGGAPSNAGIVVTQTTPSKAVAETTNGVAEQRKGLARNPFAPLPEAVKAQQGSAKGESTKPASSAGSSSASAPSSSSSAPTSAANAEATSPAKSESKPTPASKPAAPSKPQPVYNVAVLFGVIPPQTPAEGVQLTPYENIKLFTPLPSAQLPLVAYRGVTAKAKSATFTLVGEVILHGSAACLPSASQCQAIGLKEGQTEQLEYLPADGQAVTYELRVVSITASSASAASVKDPLGNSSKAGQELLSREGLMTLPGLRYSPQVGALVLAGHPAFAATASSHR